jgi:uncharacterized protein (DUF924 family)
MTEQSEAVLQFWFPSELRNDREAITRQAEWWFRGGADSAILEQFPPLLEQAERGELDSWVTTPRSRLALIIVLDQFSRTVFRGSARAFAQDAKAVALTLEGIDVGHYAALETPWQKTFFFLPLGHSENLEHVDRAVALAEELVEEVPQEIRWWFEFSVSQARGHREVISRFGRHPHRNVALGRPSTPEELDYLARGEFVHTRSLPR